MANEVKVNLIALKAQAERLTSMVDFLLSDSDAVKDAELTYREQIANVVYMMTEHAKKIAW